MLDDRSFWRMAAILLGIVSFCKGVRLPSRWAATQAMVSYDQGLLKRGFFGETFGHWLHLEHYIRFSVVSYVLIAVFVALLALLVERSGALVRLGSGEPVALFFASFAVTYLAHLVGYLDIPLGILTLAVLLIKDVRVRFFVAAPFCLIALLIHESFFLIFLPVVLFSFVVDSTTLQNGRRRLEAWGMCGILLCGAAATTAKLALLRPMTPQQVEALKREIARRADFPVRDDFFMVLQVSTIENLKMMKQHFLHQMRWDIMFLVSLAIFLPTLLLLFVAIARTLRGVGCRGYRRLLGAAAIVAASSPVWMHLLGWDSARWDALVCLETFLVLLILCRSLPGGTVLLPGEFRNATILVIALSMATGETLMDGKEIHTFPFSGLTNLVHSVRQVGWTPPQS
ncbi:MAG TPA: hypothetical protein VNW54_03935 [Granulicella sp.]|nr:hypothetical protein [Granulicella sp.]